MAKKWAAWKKGVASEQKDEVVVSGVVPIHIHV